MSGPLISPLDPPVLFSGRALRVLRTAHEVSQVDLSAKIGVRPATVRDWEKGRSTPSVERLCSLAVVLDCKISAFFLDTRVEADEMEQAVIA
jgi:transcriptional regulator with XRE-family HTH domain